MIPFTYEVKHVLQIFLKKDELFTELPLKLVIEEIEDQIE